MQRRDFIKGAGIGAIAATGLTTQVAQAKTEFRWKMVTTWPKNFPGLGTGANYLAKLITEMSGKRIKVKVYGANELVPAFEIFDAVAKGTAQMGHGSAYYWKGKHPAMQFFSTVPFGMTAREMNAWIYHKDGLKLWHELYGRFGLLSFPAGNTGVQMGGWFNKEINSLADMKGLKMRIPGLGGEVLKRLGGTPVNLPGGELYTALATGTIDATEWVNPDNDLAFGLYKAAKYYYFPGFHEPGTILESMINKKAYQALPKDLRKIVTIACQAANMDMLAEFDAKNPQALMMLKKKHGIQPKAYPKDVLEALKKVSHEVVAEIAEHDAFSKKVYTSYKTFLEQSIAFNKISSQAYLNARN